MALERGLIPVPPVAVKAEAIALATQALGRAPNPAQAALAAGALDAPYLASLIRRDPDGFAALPEHAPSSTQTFSLPEGVAVETALRRAKARAHLTCAAFDLSGQWSQDAVTTALSDFADLACQVALAEAAGRLGYDAAAPAGFFVLALGKHGARELNYSSDIDLIALFDPEVFEGVGASPKQAATRLVQDMAAILERRDADGYVFRVDLRLRPDPNSTPACVSTRFALGYYEDVGQNWERMAHIKARLVAGDRSAAERYLEALSPFVWRRHFDYWALADVHSIKRQIHASGRHGDFDDPAFDVKLGRGGLREIEFFVQTQQLILGGRQPEFRVASTFDALEALAAADPAVAQNADALWSAYCLYRMVEHRVQMRLDEQTHTLPKATATRAAIARLSGMADLAAFDGLIRRTRLGVHGVYADLFAAEERLASETGNLVFTGVDDDPGTLRTLTEMGFERPSDVIDRVRDWHRGKWRATRSARGRELLTRLTPRLLADIAASGEPDVALDRFSKFLADLPSGVQTLSLLLAQPALQRDLIATLVYAPRLAEQLARRPALIDAILAPGFARPLAEDPPGVWTELFAEGLAPDAAFEDALNIARRLHREARLRIGWSLVNGISRSSDVAAAYADLADATLDAMVPFALRAVEAQMGPAPGPFVVVALGSFGARDMRGDSDLDLMVIYDQTDAEAPAATFFSRFTQRLITALSAATEEGALYDVDMQLRPSGNAGPVAVRLSAFEAYYADSAWTWEFMALSRLRVAHGDPDLARRVEAATRAAMARPRDPERLRADIHDMRLRLEKERPGKAPWDLKLCAGGVVDLEFLLQHALLALPPERAGLAPPDNAGLLAFLEGEGAFDPVEAKLLREADTLYRRLRQVVATAMPNAAFRPEAASDGLRRRLASVGGADSFEALEARLTDLQARVSALRARKIGRLATESAAPPV